MRPPRAQFAALFDGLIKEDVWKLHGETLLSEHDHSLIRRRHEARRKWPGERISWPVSAVPEADRGEENRAESKPSRRQESGSGAGGGKPPCASRGSWKESKNQHAPIKPGGERDAHGRTRGWIFRGSNAALARVSSLAKLSRAVVRVTRMSELAPGCPFRWRRGKDLRWLPGADRPHSTIPAPSAAAQPPEGPR